MRKIGRIAGLWRYPVKSLAGEALNSAAVETSGVVGDRAWVLKDRDTSEIVNCKLIPALLTMGATYPAPPQSDAEPIDAVVSLPDGREILTSNPYAAQAISAFAGRALELWPLQPASNAEHYRLRRAMSPAVTLQRMGMKASDPFPDFSNYEPTLLSELQYFATPRGSHKDAFPLHFVTSASLESARRHYPGIDISAERFRPNFAIETENEDGFPEFDWDGFDLIVGGAVLHVGQRTIRCSMPSQKQQNIAAEPRISAFLRALTDFYFGANCLVREPGLIKMGDEVFLEKRAHLQPVRLSAPPLPDGINAPSPAPNASPRFQTHRVTFRRDEAQDVVTFGLTPLNGDIAPYLPGQHITLRVRPDADAPPIVRSYSLSNAPGGDCYTITVKRDGLCSTYLHGTPNAGDEVELGQPRGRFALIPTDPRPAILISNGIGVTPLFAMLQSIAAENPARRVLWIHATQNSATHSFATQVRTLAARLPSLTRHIVYRAPLAADAPGVDYDSTERDLRDVLQAFDGLHDAETFLCGGAHFLSDTQDALRALGVTERIHTEQFAPAATPPGQAPTSTEHHKILFTRSKIEAEWRSGGPTLLELAEHFDLPVESGCRFGACEACKVGLASGDVRYADDGVKMAADEILLCCAIPRSNLEVDL